MKIETLLRLPVAFALGQEEGFPVRELDLLGPALLGSAIA